MVRGCFVGSGSEGLQQPEVCAQIIALTGKAPADITICYLGTATYDIVQPKINQTGKLVSAGCKLTQIICGVDGTEEMRQKVDSADVLIISGGNTLYAIDYWNKVGLSAMLKGAADKGTVLSGGSAGAICWFDAGHSDSADSDSYKDAMIREAEAAVVAATCAVKDESTGLEEGQAAKLWEYIRVGCLGFLPGLVCPHADKVQSNGVLRVTDFDKMLLRHSGERGICIDHFAALVVEGDQYSVLSLPGRPGSVLESGAFSETRAGTPGIWVKDVTAEGKIVTRLAEPKGYLSELLKEATSKLEDPRCDQCRLENPIT